MLPETTTMLASARGSGSDGPAAHGPKLPIPTVGATYTSETAFVPSEPAMYSSFVPTWTTVPSVRGCGNASSSGEPCHGTIAPTGAGQGRDSFSGGHRLIGDQAS